MLKNLKFEDFVGLYPNESFEMIKKDDSNEIYLIKNKKKIKIAFIDRFEYCILHNTHRLIPLTNFESIKKTTKQILSSYLFFMCFFHDQRVVDTYLRHIHKVKAYHKDNPYVNLKYHLKLNDAGNIIVIPDITMGPMDYIFVSNYSSDSDILQITSSLSLSSFWSNQLKTFNFDLKTPESSFKELNKFLYTVYFKKYLTIDSEEFTYDHLNLLKMAIL